MWFGKRKWCALLFLLVAVAIGGIGCRGFFVNPTLTSITVSTLGSTNLSTPGSTVQLIATGNYDDGSHKNLTGAATWSKSNDPSNLVTVSTGGLVTANSVPTTSAQVTVQAAAQSSDGSVVSGTITLTIGQAANSLVITANPSSPSLSGSGGPGVGTIQFTATLNGTDVTSTTTFTSNNSNVILITSGSTGTLEGTGTATITGTNSSSGATGSLNVTVNP